MTSDEMRASILAYTNMVKAIRPLLTVEAPRKFITEEQRRLEQERRERRDSGEEK